MVQFKLMYTQQRSRPSSTKSGFLDWGLLSSGLGGAVAVLSSSGSLAPAVDGKDPGNPPGKPPTPQGNELLNTSIILASLGFDLYFSILVGFFIISCRAAITSGSLILDNRSIKFAPAEKPPGILGSLSSCSESGSKSLSSSPFPKSSSSEISISSGLGTSSGVHDAGRCKQTNESVQKKSYVSYDGNFLRSAQLIGRGERATG
uniref:Uncharacterized protein n=1 Tax=Glossina palpalis gambiensis TaxID=67801 RepID=A0A1B0BX67_9MUSC